MVQDQTAPLAALDTPETTSPAAIFTRLVVAAVLLLLPIFYFYPAVLGKATLAPGDGWTQIFGIRVLIGQMIRQGQLPLWNPYIFSGMPLLASIQPGALYPPTWLFAILSPQAAMNWMVITTYHIALIGTYFYSRRIGANRLGSILAGIAFAFGGYMIAHLGHTNRVAAAAWLPWILLAIEELYLRVRWQWIALGALFIALQLFAGEPQMMFYTVLVAGAYGLFSLFWREPRGNRRPFLFALASMALCGVLLSAVQLLPERELLAQGERAKIAYEYFSEFSLPPQHFAQLIFPYFFGGAGMPPYQIVYWGRWNTTETTGYVGMLAMLFVLIAAIGNFTEQKRNRLVWFWAGCALLALMLALGSNLPFKLNRVLYQVPVYRLFRASGRHLFEFDFALAVLTGIGATWITQKATSAKRRAIIASLFAMTAIVAVTVILYRFFPDLLMMDLPVTQGQKSFANYELMLPVLFFFLSLLALVLYWLGQQRFSILKHLAGAAMVMILMLDVASFGFFYEWNIVPEDLPQRLADGPTVKFVKGRERDLNGFRVISHSAWPYDRNYEMLDFPNVSIVRGLQSVNGYDPLFLRRYGEVAGSMGLEGIINEPFTFGAADQGLNLLNAKYLFFERTAPDRSEFLVEHDGIRFSDRPVEMKLSSGKELDITATGAATELAVISTMARSANLASGTPVVDITIHTRDGRAIKYQLLAGRDTSEWAYDRPSVKAIVKHDRARVAESFPAGDYEGHRYLARFPFDRADVDHIEMKYLQDEADLTIVKASLYDAATGKSSPLDVIGLPLQRWRKLATFDAIEVYENLNALPRAWFVRQAVVAPSQDVLKVIKSGKMMDGSVFHPAETALFEREDFGARQPVLPRIGETTGAEVRITHYEPRRIELQTRNGQPGLLVLSEVYYRGWEARIDGQRAPIEKVDYILRGLAVPAGEHRIEYVFRAHSFRTGVAYSGLGVLLLCLIGVIHKRKVATTAV